MNDNKRSPLEQALNAVRGGREFYDLSDEEYVELLNSLRERLLNEQKGATSA